MTINDFYKVTDVLGKSKVKVRQLKNKRISGSWSGEETYSNEFKPYEKEMVKMVNTRTGQPRIKINDFNRPYKLDPKGRKVFYFNHMD